MNNSRLPKPHLASMHKIVVGFDRFRGFVHRKRTIQCNLAGNRRRPELSKNSRMNS
jgi:hypothetical protein